MRRNVTLNNDDTHAGEPDSPHRITVHLDEMLTARGMTLTELSNRVGVALPNLSILKTGRARAVRFSTLSAICKELDCQPGDLLRCDLSQREHP